MQAIHRIKYSTSRKSGTVTYHKDCNKMVVENERIRLFNPAHFVKKFLSRAPAMSPDNKKLLHHTGYICTDKSKVVWIVYFPVLMNPDDYPHEAYKLMDSLNFPRKYSFPVMIATPNSIKLYVFDIRHRAQISNHPIVAFVINYDSQFFDEIYNDGVFYYGNPMTVLIPGKNIHASNILKDYMDHIKACPDQCRDLPDEPMPVPEPPPAPEHIPHEQRGVVKGTYSMSEVEIIARLHDEEGGDSFMTFTSTRLSGPDKHICALVSKDIIVNQITVQGVSEKDIHQAVKNANRKLKRVLEGMGFEVTNLSSGIGVYKDVNAILDEEANAV